MLVTISGQSRTATDTYGQSQVPPRSALEFAPGREGLQSRKHASADPAEGGGLAAQVTGSAYGAIGRDQIDPALPVGP